MLTARSMGAAVIDAKSSEVQLKTPVAEIAGTLLLPTGSHNGSYVLILGGTLSHTRDGGMIREGVPARDALKRLAEALAGNGYASLRYDKVGYGSSKATLRWRDTYSDDAIIAAEAIRFLRSRSDCNQVIIAGESAGAYVACLAARDSVSADAYLFLGGLCGSVEELYDYNFGGLLRWAESNPLHMKFAMEHARRALALGRQYKRMLGATKAGKEKFEIVDNDYREVIGLLRHQEELQWPPDDMFRYIKVPAIAIAGERDLNVPPFHAQRAAEVMQRNGNQNSTSLVIPGADHNFQKTPEDQNERIQERHSFKSFERPYEPKLYEAVSAWLQRTAPTEKLKSAVSVSTGSPAVHATVPTVNPATDSTPERIELTPGVEIIQDLTDTTKTPAVETLEGRIGPLLLGEGSQTHFIDMPAGLYLEEHPHSTESIIYTVRGTWVLCSRGRRFLMKPGSLFHFGANVPTGYEVPFREGAYILIFKGSRTTKSEKEFIDYLKSLATRVRDEHDKGKPFLLKELPPDHPALRFSSQVNPKFNEVLKN